MALSPVCESTRKEPISVSPRPVFPCASTPHLAPRTSNTHPCAFAELRCKKWKACQCLLCPIWTACVTSLMSWLSAASRWPCCVHTHSRLSSRARACTFCAVTTHRTRGIPEAVHWWHQMTGNDLLILRHLDRSSHHSLTRSSSSATPAPRPRRISALRCTQRQRLN